MYSFRILRIIASILCISASLALANDVKYCPSSTRVDKIEVKWDDSSSTSPEENLGRLKSVRFGCKGSSWIGSESVVVASGSRETVGTLQCPPGGWAQAYQILQDNLGIVDMRLYCTNQEFNEYQQHRPKGPRTPTRKCEGSKCEWSEVVRCPFGAVMCGLRTYAKQRTRKRYKKIKIA